MFPSTVFLAAFAFLGLAVALPKSGSRLTAPPDDQTLLSTCPGAAGTYFNITSHLQSVKPDLCIFNSTGSPDVERADRCTYINVVNNPDTRIWSNVGDPQLK